MIITPDTINERIRNDIKIASEARIAQLEKLSRRIGIGSIVSTIFIIILYVLTITGADQNGIRGLSGVFVVIAVLVHWMRSTDVRIGIMKLSLNPKVIDEIKGSG